MPKFEKRLRKVWKLINKLSKIKKRLHDDIVILLNLASDLEKSDIKKETKEIS
jgi:hypothetical protein